MLHVRQMTAHLGWWSLWTGGLSAKRPSRRHPSQRQDRPALRRAHGPDTVSVALDTALEGRFIHGLLERDCAGDAALQSPVVMTVAHEDTWRFTPAVAGDESASVGFQILLLCVVL